MKKHIIDTNCLISYITDRNLKQQKAISHYFNLAFNYNIELIVIANVITEFAYVLTNVYKIENTKVKEIISDLLKTPGIKYEMGYLPINILNLWPKKINNYGDAVVAAFGEKHKTEILTFDVNFSKELNQINIKNKIPH